MIFKDRQDAGEKLSEKLLQDKIFLKNKKNIIVVSLLRGGVAVGKIIAEKLKTNHIPLAVTKIGSPSNSELAIGAVCFDGIFLQKDTIRRLSLKKGEIDLQTTIAKLKHKAYVKNYDLGNTQYEKILKDKIVIIVDDGAATGATTKAALLFVQSKKPKKTILAIPVAPTDFDSKGFDKTVILHRDDYFSSVSQFYTIF